MSDPLEHIWTQVRAELSREIDEPVYRIWLEPLQAVSLSGDTITVCAPSHTCTWVRDRFGRALQTCAAAVLGPEAIVDVVDAGRFPPSGPQKERSDGHKVLQYNSHGSHLPDRGPEPISPVLSGNPKLTFEQFVIGDSNRLAHAAALTVSELPGQAYNPLFICGAPGVGKTHLLRSIATYIASHNPALQVRSATGEAFTTEFLSALGGGSLDSFKSSFRRADVLLIDDVQFLERKSRTEEEFFHTFNELYEAGSQIVLTSDRPPRDLQALEDRLRERFQSGLVADISPPDMATRLAILRKRVNHDGIELEDPQVLDLLAERIAINVRALEGALIRLVAFSSLTARAITPELTNEVLDKLYPQTPPRERSIEEIKEAACQQFGITSEEMLSSKRTVKITWPRQVAMYLSRELTHESLPAIGRAFGGRDHTTVLHAWRQTEQRIASNPSSRASVDAVRERLLRSKDDRHS